MKKILFFAFALVAGVVAFTSCDPTIRRIRNHLI